MFTKLRQNDKPSRNLQARILVFHYPFQPTTSIPALDVVRSLSSYRTGTSQSQYFCQVENQHLPHNYILQSDAGLLMQQTLNTTSLKLQ